MFSNPISTEKYTYTHNADVNIGRHVIIGTGSIILPGVTLEEGVAVGALSLMKKDCLAFGIYMGSPAKRISERKQNFLALEKQFINSKVSI